MAQLNLLGPFQIEGPTGRIDRLPTRKSLALLSVLALAEGRHCDRAELIEMLWPLSGADQGRASLRQELSVLRKALAGVGLDPLRIDKGAIWLDPAVLASDAAAFRAAACARPTEAELTLAAGLYRGALLEGVALAVDPFTGWLDRTRARLADLALTVRLRLLASAEQAGAAEAIRAAARAVLDLDPGVEAAHRALILDHVAAGRRRQALAQYEICCKVLRDDLDVMPSAELRRIGAMLMTGAEAAGPVRAAQTAPMAAGEKRIVAALAVGLVEASLLAAELDPEDLAATLARFRDLVADVVARHGGRVQTRTEALMLAVFDAEAGADRATEQALGAAVALARACLTEALAHAEATGEHCFDAEVRRRQARLPPGDLAASGRVASPPGAERA